MTLAQRARAAQVGFRLAQLFDLAWFWLGFGGAYCRLRPPLYVPSSRLPILLPNQSGDSFRRASRLGITPLRTPYAIPLLATTLRRSTW